jgi:dTDP-glucose 4,6-dehydratase
MKAVITGGAGFIGSHAVEAFLALGWDVTNLDKLTYAGDLRNLEGVAAHPGYRFVQGDLCDAGLVRELLAGSDLVVNFAAETHVDRSLLDPAVFARTDVEGVVCLLEAIRADGRAALLHMSTDEVFGSLPAPEEATEERVFAPSSPYSASKAAAELMIRAYCESYGLPVTVVRACNVFGPRQHAEKFIPLFTLRALMGEDLPLYGDGLQEREWLFVEDVAAALTFIASRMPADGYQQVHAGSGFRVANFEVARTICQLTERPIDLIRPVTDRPGHDRRYALDSSRLRAMGWAPKTSFEDGLRRTVEWFAENGKQRVSEDEGFAEYFERQYGERL